MAVNRTIEYDSATKLIKAKALTEDTFSVEQVRNILTNSQNQLKTIDSQIKKHKTMEFAVKRLKEDARLKEVVDVLGVFMQAEIPDLEAVRASLKFQEEQKAQLEKDIIQLSEVLKSADEGKDIIQISEVLKRRGFR